MKLFQRVWEEENIPEDWEYNVIIFLNKKGGTARCENCRAVCLFSVVIKIYTRMKGN